jgi:hypothetical protein
LGQLLWLLDEAADQVTINVDVVASLDAAQRRRRPLSGARLTVAPPARNIGCWSIIPSRMRSDIVESSQPFKR